MNKIIIGIYSFFTLLLDTKESDMKSESDSKLERSISDTGAPGKEEDTEDSKRKMSIMTEEKVQTGTVSFGH